MGNYVDRKHINCIVEDDKEEKFLQDLVWHWVTELKDAQITVVKGNPSYWENAIIGRKIQTLF